VNIAQKACCSRLWFIVYCITGYYPGFKLPLCLVSHAIQKLLAAQLAAHPELADQQVMASKEQLQSELMRSCFISEAYAKIVTEAAFSQFGARYEDKATDLGSPPALTGRIVDEDEGDVQPSGVLLQRATNLLIQHAENVGQTSQGMDPLIAAIQRLEAVESERAKQLVELGSKLDAVLKASSRCWQQQLADHTLLEELAKRMTGDVDRPHSYTTLAL